MTTDEILDDIAKSLAAAATNGRDDRAIAPAMQGFEQLARLVHAGTTSWNDLRRWAAAHAAEVSAARSAIEEWSLQMGRSFSSDGEQGIERALDQRSQLEFARTLFAGTQAIDTLEVMTDTDGDEEFREEAERLALDPPDFVPRTHTWWRWKDAD